MESRDFREVTGSSLHSGQRAHLLFGNCGQFADMPGALVHEIFLRRLDLTDVGDVSWQRNSLTEIFGDFFGPSEYRNWPAMVWTTPAYVSIKNHFGRWLPSRLRPASQMVQDRFRSPQHGRNRIPIAFALGSPVWNIEFRRLKLVHPEGFAPGVPLVRIYSEHPAGTTADGIRLDTSLDINLGFAEPAVNNPVVRLNYPSYAGYRRRDSETGLEILNFRVVHLIRMRPRGSFMESWVQQGILTVDEVNGNIIHISGAQRTFTTFQACYAHLGLPELLAAIDGVAD